MTRSLSIPVPRHSGGHHDIDLPQVTAILDRVMQAIARFVNARVTTAIDLRAEPHMGKSTYQSLKDTLSVGEVTAKVESVVTVDISETQYPGVWWLTHRNERGCIVTELIEISEIPAILKAHVTDMRAGLQRLEGALADSSTLTGTNEAFPCVVRRGKRQS